MNIQLSPHAQVSPPLVRCFICSPMQYLFKVIALVIRAQINDNNVDFIAAQKQHPATVLRDFFFPKRWLPKVPLTFNEQWTIESNVSYLGMVPSFIVRLGLAGAHGA